MATEHNHRQGFREAAARFGPIFGVLVAVHTAWAIGNYVLQVRSVFLPNLLATYGVLGEMLVTRDFWLDLAASWGRVTVAFLASFLVAYPLSLISIVSQSGRRAVFLCAEFFRYLPVPVFLPLTILWFGVSDSGKVVVVFLGTFAQMIPMFYDSTRNVREKHVATIAALRWRPVDVILKVVIPGSAPSILDNARVCLGWAWTYLIVAELLGARHGIGYAIIRAQRYLATDKIFAYVIVIGLMGIATDRIIRSLRTVLFHWDVDGSH